MNGYEFGRVSVTMMDPKFPAAAMAANVKDVNPAQADRMPRLINRVLKHLFCSKSPQFSAVMLLLLAFVCAGCGEKPTVRQYTIPGKMPDVLAVTDRMLGAMIPQKSAVWFVKVVGPADSVKLVESQIRDFVTGMTFTADGPNLSKPPVSWNRGPEKQMRFATFLVNTPESQLDISISQLPLSGDWDQQVAMNVNRWRDQMKLPSSSEKWAGAQPIQVAAAEKEAAWVDLSGETGAGAAMSAMAGTTRSPPPAAVPPVEALAEPDSELKFDKPEPWRQGNKSMMRMAAFDIGPETEPAELTIIPAGGDLRGNVARWLGQARGDSPPEQVVNDALAAAESIQVNGRDAKRYFLSGDVSAIDATIVPLDNGMSLFIKATGPPATVHAEKERIGDFLRSLVLP